MARAIHSRLKINGKLVAETPLHVGGIGGNSDTDMALAVNGKDELYVPGTSIAGVSRAWCERNFTEKDKDGNDAPIKEIKELFGFQKDDSGQASFVLVEDATIENAKDILTEIRDGVGIDRYYGVAAEGAKYDREILPKGTKLNFEMIVEIADRKLKPKEKRKNTSDIYDETEEQFERRIKETKAIFGHLLEALQKGELRFGGSRTRGLGKLKLTDSSFKEQNFNGYANTLKVLKNEFEDVVITDETKKSIEFKEKPRLDISIEWSPVQPLMVKAGFEGIGVDMLPLTSQKENGKVSLVLPGSSIKGSLRSQAERIMRTLLGNYETKGENLHEQIKIPLVDEIFGAKAEKGGNGTKGLGALAIDDCFAEKTFDTETWNDVTTGKTTMTENKKEVEVSFGQQPLWLALEKIKHKPKDENGEETSQEIMSFAIEHHNAIDRFTGGTADGALYSVLAPTKISWDKMQFSLDFSRTENPRQCLMLLLLVLRDLTENRLPLGFATNRGMGEVKVKSIKLKGKNLEGFENEIVLNEGKMSKLDKTFKENLAEEWKKWLTKQK